MENRRFRYSTLAKIASGGTATVYVGARGAGGALVALKRPHAHVLEDARQRREVLREASIAATLHHPNIVAVRAVESSSDELQLVMEYVEGAALGTLIAFEARRDARIPTPVALRILVDACDGLAALHRGTDREGNLLGLVHRDVSPQNILVGVDGRARLTDFGLARALYSDAPSTTQGTLKGKLGYMAPEYVQGGQVDQAVDVFAMGVVLWETLAGLRLFRGDNEGQTLDRVLRDNPASLGDVTPELALLDPVVRGATAKDPRARFVSGAELARALGEATRTSGAIAAPDAVAAYVESVVGSELAERRSRVAAGRTAMRRPWQIGGAFVLTAAGAGLALGLLSPRAGQPATSVAPIIPTTSASPGVAEPPLPAHSTTPLPVAPSAAPLAVPASTAPRTRPVERRGPALPPNPYDRPSH